MRGYMQELLVLLLCLFVSSCLSQNIADYCELGCGDEEMNILCSHKASPKWAKDCFGLKTVTTPKSRRDLLDWHNQLRDQVAHGLFHLNPSANMRKLSWAIELEASATAWLKYCEIGLAKCRKTWEFSEVGQNYYAISSDTQFPTSSQLNFQSWMEGVFLFDAHLQRNYSSKEMHQLKPLLETFVQLIWADTYKLGCAEAVYQQSRVFFRALVCNYGPGGLVEGTSVFQEGPPCSACPNTTQCFTHSSFPNLCSSLGDSRNYSSLIDVDEEVAAILRNEQSKQQSLSWAFVSTFATLVWLVNLFVELKQTLLYK